MSQPRDNRQDDLFRLLLERRSSTFAIRWCRWRGRSIGTFWRDASARCAQNFLHGRLPTEAEIWAIGDPSPLKWSDLRYVFDIKEDCNGTQWGPIIGRGNTSICCATIRGPLALLLMANTTL